jgi:hypothetical protein
VSSFGKVVSNSMRTSTRWATYEARTHKTHTDTDTPTHHAREDAVSAIEVADTPQRHDERGVAVHARVDGQRLICRACRLLYLA